MLTVLAIAIPATACALVALGVWLGHGYGRTSGYRAGYDDGHWDGRWDGVEEAGGEGMGGPRRALGDDTFVMLSGDDPDTAYEPADTSHHDYRGGGR